MMRVGQYSCRRKWLGESTANITTISGLRIAWINGLLRGCMTLGSQSSSASSMSHTCREASVTEGNAAQSAVMKVQMTPGLVARACWMFRNIVVLPRPGEPTIATLPDNGIEQTRYLTPSSSNPITTASGWEIAGLALIEGS